MRFSALRVLFAGILVCSAAPSQGDNGLAAYKAANYAVAIPLLRTASDKAPTDPIIQAALLSSLVYENKTDEAAELDEQVAKTFPNSPEVTAARGEFAFYMADMAGAEQLFKAAIKLKEDTPRAIFGLARLYRAASLYRSGRLACLRAHELDPDDAFITQTFLRYVPAAKHKELLPPFAAAHPWLYKRYQEDQENSTVIEAAVGDKKLFETENGPQETTLRFVTLMRDARYARGVGLELKIANGHPLRMLFDTGASGIIVKQSAIDKVGLEHLGSAKAWGIGDAGARDTFASVAPTCQVGTLTFKNCLVKATEGKRSVAGDEDGLIGADFFQDYVVGIDFQKRLLHLKPLPPRPNDVQGYDRVISPEEKSFTPVFRFGHMLMIPTVVNRECRGLFLLDTGAAMTNIDSTFARLSTKLHGNDWMRIHGISGEVKKVYEADKAELSFGRFRQENVGLIAFNLNNSPDREDVRMSGIMGIPLLSMFNLTIDYRNGLVNFDYLFK